MINWSELLSISILDLNQTNMKPAKVNKTNDIYRTSNKIINQQNQMSVSNLPHQGSYIGDEEAAPKREQWALINNYKALQYERLQQLQKADDMQKKRKFKQELDYQVYNKSDVAQVQKMEDKRYYEYITKKAEEQKMREQREKMEKYIKRKHIEEENQHHLDYMKNSRNKDEGPGDNMNIGIKAQMQRKRREEEHKREMLDTLDKQLRIKQQEKKMQKMQDLQQDQHNLKYQYEQFDKRRYRFSNHGQNPKVYQYYRDLEVDRIRRERELEHRLVDEAAQRKMEEEDYKRYRKQSQKRNLTEQMKSTLDQQVQFHNYQNRQKSRFNPQDNTYSVIGNIFKQKQSPYDKRAYSEYLKRQAEQQNKRKRKQKYMSEQQYRINMNQLNRALNGNYAHQQYIDRSLGSLGDPKKVNMTQIHDKVEDQDVEVVKTKLEHLKNRMYPKSHNVSGIF